MNPVRGRRDTPSGSTFKLELLNHGRNQKLVHPHGLTKSSILPVLIFRKKNLSTFNFTVKLTSCIQWLALQEIHSLQPPLTSINSICTSAHIPKWVHSRHVPPSMCTSRLLHYFMCFLLATCSCVGLLASIICLHFSTYIYSKAKIMMDSRWTKVGTLNTNRLNRTWRSDLVGCETLNPSQSRWLLHL